MKIKTNCFDPEMIAFSGQCFRWRKIDDNRFLVPAADKLLLICRTEETDVFELDCSEKLYEEYWKDYLDLGRDYSSIGERIISGNDEHLKEAFENGKGIRILRQDLWEMIVSFMISQNNNIKRISGSIEKICSRFGKLIDSEHNIYSFPTPEMIDVSIFDDASLGLGYRAPYLRDLVLFVRDNPDWLVKLKKLDYDQAMEALLKIKGIGKKVANCICLFGLGFTDAFPIDTHVKQILDKYYSDGLDLQAFPNEKGIIQQYLFYYELTVK